VTAPLNRPAVGGVLSLLLLCSGVAAPRSSAIIPATDLPAEVSINKEAGRGGLLIVTLRLDGGDELPFLVDTGATGTVLGKSLEPKLGKRLGKGTTSGWESKRTANVYAAPKLYLGNTRLMTADKVWIGDSDRQGTLGMDCLEHYCIQLDFEAGKMRFLKPDQVITSELGKAFSLTIKGNLPYIHHASLIPVSGANLMIDVGCRVDGLEDKSEIKGLAQILPECVWDGETYSNLAVAAVEHANVIGLNFLARHLVTLDFPNRTMYLKKTSVGALAGSGSTEIDNDEIQAPAKFLESLKEGNQLPGLSNEDKGMTYVDAYSNFDPQSMTGKGLAYSKGYFKTRHNSVTFDFWKKGDSSIYRYQINRASEDSPWKLQKAWRTDQNNRMIEEYPVP
jgi:hypothetical protein